MAYSASPVASAAKAVNAVACTTAAVNMSSADIIFVHVVDDDRTTRVTLGDSQGLTWSPLTTHDCSDFIGSKLYYCQGAGIGSASHTFNIGTPASVAGLAVLGFSGSASSPFDQQNGNNYPFGSGFQFQTNGVTPGFANEIVITGLGWYPPTTTLAAVDIGAIGVQAQESGGIICVGISYHVQTTATAEDVQWTIDVTHQRGVALSIASFKAAAAGGGTFGPIVQGGSLTRGGLIRGGRLVT